MTKYDKILVAIPVEKRLPDLLKQVIVVMKSGQHCFSCLEDQNGTWDSYWFKEDDMPEYWLEHQSSQIVMSIEELREVFNAGMRRQISITQEDSFSPNPGFKTYLKQKGIEI